MKKKLLFLVAALSIIYSCKKTFLDDGDKLEDEFSIRSVKQYYDNLESSKPKISNTSTADKKINLFWTKAYQSKYGLTDYIEVPIITTNAKIVLYNFPLDSVKFKPDLSVVERSIQRMVFYKDQLGKINLTILTYTPDREYLIRRKGEVHLNSIKKMQKNFSGYMEYRNLDGKLICILRIKGGKVIRKYIIKDTSIVPKNTASIFATVCSEYCNPIYEKQCSYTGETDSEGFAVILCQNVQVGESCSTYCYENNDPPTDPCPSGDCNGDGTVDEGDTTYPTPKTEAQLSEDLAVELDKKQMLVDCDLVEQFKPLASYVGPTSVFDRISNLNDNTSDWTLFSDPFFVQKIQNAVGYQINLDKFEINVNSLPVVNGQALTANQFLNYIRLNINTFIDNNTATFAPYHDPSDQINDTQRWNSSNPLGSILHLNMVDDGSVIVSDYASNYWTVSTIRTPLDGAHPVSGNRKWGYNLNADGSYTYYVTGVDRLTTGRHEIAQYIFGIPFSGADELWESFQSKVSSFVNTHSGSASIGGSIKERPNYAALRDYFDGKITLAQLKAAKGCQ
jgi:hypothetical protein